jgi:hypothetical protein
MQDDARKDVLGEQLLSELHAIHELVQDVPSMKSDLNQVKADVTDLKADMQAVKAVQREHSQTLQEHSQLLKKHSRDLTEIMQDGKLLKTEVSRHDEDIAELKRTA